MGYVRKLMVMFMLLNLLIHPVRLHAAAAETGLQMDVGQVGQKTASFSVGERHSWYIRSGIPDNWEELQSFSVLQTLSPGLTLETDTISVLLIQENGDQVPLIMEKEYQMTAGSVFVEQGTADRLVISLTPEGMELIAERKEIASELRICYHARINQNAAMGTQILGSAQLSLTDTDGGRKLLLSDKAVAACGGFHVALDDPDGNPVSGARFMLAREAAQEEVTDQTATIELLDTGEETIAVVYEEFYASDDMRGEKTYTAETDEAGMAVCYGLAYGTYYLVQTESPRDYLLPAKPVTVAVNEVSHLTKADGWVDRNGDSADNTIHVTSTLLVMPQTGGPGTVPYTASGAAVILCACMLLWYNRKRKVLI